MNVFDIHVHPPWRDADQPRPDAALERLRAQARLNGITGMLLLPLATGDPPAVLQRRNEAALCLKEADPDYFQVACYLNPEHDPEFSRREGKRCAGRGALFIKEHVDLLATDLRQDPISHLAAELDLPILFHAWYKTAQRYPNESHAGHLAELARRHPRTRYVVAHLTGIGRRGVQDLADLPNVWVDTSGGLCESGIVEYAVRYLGAGRILYGSDWGVGRDFAGQLGRVLGANLTEAEREQILWRNAAVLLRLPATPKVWNT